LDSRRLHYPCPDGASVDVADALSLTVASARSRIHRGRMQLRELLDPDLAA